MQGPKSSNARSPPTNVLSKTHKTPDGSLHGGVNFAAFAGSNIQKAVCIAERIGMKRESTRRISSSDDSDDEDTEGTQESVQDTQEDMQMLLDHVLKEL